ncbi:MAG: hypothetical protein IPJ79_07675 [Bacteroidetes bacterium]|nr:hypothetical protein [Bacteroidota bacterium]
MIITKKIKYIVLIILLNVLFLHTKAQFIPYKNLDIASQQFSIDNLGNVFALHKGVISKHDENSKLLNVYQDKGRLIDFIDANNPLRIIAYSSVFATVYFFDSQLAMQSAVKLREAIGGNPLLVCNSSTASFWVYDQATTVLTSYNDQLQPQSQSQPINLTVPDFSAIKKMYETEKWLVLLTDNNKFLIFDVAGNYFKSIQAHAPLDFGINSEAIISLENAAIKLYGIKNNEASSLSTVIPAECYGLKFSNKKLFLANPMQINILKLAE